MTVAESTMRAWGAAPLGSFRSPLDPDARDRPDAMARTAARRNVPAVAGVILPHLAPAAGTRRRFRPGQIAAIEPGTLPVNTAGRAPVGGAALVADPSTRGHGMALLRLRRRR